MYDSGTSGLMAAAITNTIGANTIGHLIHMHPGNECQKNAFMAMMFPIEQSNRCINVNIYSVLRCFYQNKDSYSETIISKETESSSKDDKQNDNEENKDEETITEEPLAKKIKIDESTQKKSWQIDNEKACKLLEKKVDSLIVTSKEHPVSIVTELIPLLNGNRNLVVFNLLREPLQDLYFSLKNRTDIVNIRLMNSFMRNYQVLPGRTHPEMNMTNGGYLLTATKLNC